MTLKLNQKNKDRVRFSLYLLSAILILFYIYSIFITAGEIDKHIIEQANSPKNLLDVNLNSQEEINLNEELGGYILKIALSLIQIIFLSNFMLLLFIYEINGKRKNE